MKEPEVTSNYKETSITDSFTVKFEFNEYKVILDIGDSFGDNYLNGVNVNYVNSEDRKNLFVFDVSRQEHLHLAAKIHERVCELLEKPPQKPPTTRVSGKLT